jgi:uncharacterized protein (TIGR02145 family)
MSFLCKLGIHNWNGFQKNGCTCEDCGKSRDNNHYWDKNWKCSLCGTTNPNGNIEIINGKNYRTIQIGNQIWLADNFDDVKFNNGENIRKAKNDEEWTRLNSECIPAWCYYQFEEERSDLGRLYNWFTVNDNRGILPDGYRIPNLEDFKILVKFVGCADSLLIDGVYKGNSSGFSAFPLGCHSQLGYTNFTLLLRCGFWSSSLKGTKWDYVYYLNLEHDTRHDGYQIINYTFKGSGFSIRGIKNPA